MYLYIYYLYMYMYMYTLFLFGTTMVMFHTAGRMGRLAYNIAQYSLDNSNKPSITSSCEIRRECMPTMYLPQRPSYYAIFAYVFFFFNWAPVSAVHCENHRRSMGTLVPQMVAHLIRISSLGTTSSASRQRPFSCRIISLSWKTCVSPRSRDSLLSHVSVHSTKSASRYSSNSSVSPGRSFER